MENKPNIVTLTYLVTPRQVWLAPKLEGFGVGYLNGYGGHIEGSETEVERAILEIEQESTVFVSPKNLVAITTIDFFKEERHLFKCHIFLATSWTGTPTATKEMGVPQLYSRENPPLEKMWKGDALWAKQVLEGSIIPDGGYIRYSADMQSVLDWKLPLRV